MLSQFEVKYELKQGNELCPIIFNLSLEGGINDKSINYKIKLNVNYIVLAYTNNLKLRDIKRIVDNVIEKLIETNHRISLINKNTTEYLIMYIH